MIDHGKTEILAIDIPDARCQVRLPSVAKETLRRNSKLNKIRS